MIEVLRLPSNIATARESFRASRAETARAGKQLFNELSVFLNETAKPALLKAADHHEYARILTALMIDAGLELKHLYLVRSDLDREWRDYLSVFGAHYDDHNYSWPDGNHSDFSLCYKTWGTGNCSNPFYILEVRGNDPDGVLHAFGTLFHEVFEQARSNWPITNP
jgi:hypothetical protein